KIRNLPVIRNQSSPWEGSKCNGDVTPSISELEEWPNPSPSGYPPLSTFQSSEDWTNVPQKVTFATTPRCVPVDSSFTCQRLCSGRVSTCGTGCRSCRET